MGCHGKIYHSFIALGLCLLEQLKLGPFSKSNIAIVSRKLFLGLDYLHQEEKKRCDFKAANVLLIHAGKVKLFANFVFAGWAWLRGRHLVFGDYNNGIDQWRDSVAAYIHWRYCSICPIGLNFYAYVRLPFLGSSTTQLPGTQLYING